MVPITGDVDEATLGSMGQEQGRAYDLYGGSGSAAAGSGVGPGVGVGGGFELEDEDWGDDDGWDEEDHHDHAKTNTRG